MHVLGIDPGSRACGYAVLRSTGKPAAITYGTVHLQGPMQVRLVTLFAALTEVVETYTPVAVAIENVFIHRNVQSALKLGQARGVAICAGCGLGAQLFEYSATQVKKALTGHGRAQKVQMQYMTKRLLALNASPAQDAADALALALYHVHMHRFHAKVPQ